MRSRNIKSIYTSSVLLGGEYFSALGEVTIVPDNEVTSERLGDAELLITRSKTKVDRALLEGSRIRFVGTATAGSEHLDVDYLHQAGIDWSAAPGCNADSVAEYVIAALLHLGKRANLRLADRTLGIVGVGHIGGRLTQTARALGIRVLLNDPPLRHVTGDPGLLPLEKVLQESDIISLHVPLTREGHHSTLRMVDEHFLKQMRPGSTFINTSRGEIVDEAALLNALANKCPAFAVLDVWDHEPFVNKQLLERADIATPHIAGYSFEGRRNGTLQVYRAACRFLGKEPLFPQTLREQAPRKRIEIDTHTLNNEALFRQRICAFYDIEQDDRALRVGRKKAGDSWGGHFMELRKNYPIRHECMTPAGVRSPPGKG